MQSFTKKIRGWLVAVDSIRFDLWHNTHTRAVAMDVAQQYDVTRGFWYLPTRPSVVRRVLRDLPIQRYSETHFIDFGSGKGRVLLLAAEYPFKRLTGIEMRAPLHEMARRNLRTQRHFSVRSDSIELLNIDAREFEFSNEDMVLYFFNPFGTEIMQEILTKLQSVLQLTGRIALLVMVNSQFDELMKCFPQFEIVQRSALRSIYRSKVID